MKMLECDSCRKRTQHYYTMNLNLPFCSICCRLNDVEIFGSKVKEFRRKERKGNDTVLHNAQVEHSVIKARARERDETNSSTR